MKQFDVEITETLQRTVSAEAASREEAERLVTETWNNGDYVLDANDFVDVDFKTVGEQELSKAKGLDVLLVQPGMYPQKISIGTDLKDFQNAVGGTIAASYPFDDPVAIVYNDEGKRCVFCVIFYFPASRTASTAFCTWRRFSASVKISSA